MGADIIGNQVQDREETPQFLCSLAHSLNPARTSQQGSPGEVVLRAQLPGAWSRSEGQTISRSGSLVLLEENQGFQRGA